MCHVLQWSIIYITFMGRISQNLEKCISEVFSKSECLQMCREFFLTEIEIHLLRPHRTPFAFGIFFQNHFQSL